MPCPHCNHDQAHKCGFNNKGNLQKYKCLNCKRKYTTETKPKSEEDTVIKFKPCLNCNTITSNPKFCSSSCAATYNNHVYPKRSKHKKLKFCKKCSKPIDRQRVLCKDCNPKFIDYDQKTIADIHRVAKYQVSSQIRNIARRTYSKSGLPYVCRNCGYDKHVEICHIKAIKDFAEDTPISSVNDISNLVALCPNCHWELDRGLLHL